jgi:hypothetical protein
MGAQVCVVIPPVVLALALGCSASGSNGAPPGDDRLFVPADLRHTFRDDQGVPLTLIAFTLVEGATGPDLHAAVRNDGPTPVCEAGMMMSLFDKADQPVTDVAAVLVSGRFYRLEPGVVVTCIAPGQIAMAATTGLPTSIVIDQLGRVEHRFPLFNLGDLEEIEGLAVTGVATVAMSAGSAYTGTFTNGLGTAVSSPSVTIFPTNRVGRPLGVATASATTDVPPGGSWAFQSSLVADPGAAHVVFPGAAIPD